MWRVAINSDKSLPYFPIREANAFLGWRGIRLTLNNSGIFLTQLRAMLRANAGNENLRLLLPMISSSREVDEVRDLFDRAVRQARAVGKPISVCGEMAGDPASAVLLLGMGIDALSMASPSISRVPERSRLRQSGACGTSGKRP